jgi:basic amino acid/polyamine antiporter, APA family
MAHVTATENLKREIGVRSLALAILNITVGSGIFVIPAIIAQGLGTAAIIAYFVCGLLIFFIALCFAAAGSKTLVSGGPYTYIETAFGPYAGFLANNIYWIGGCVFSDAAISNALANTLTYFFPVLQNGLYRGIFLFVVFAWLALLNIRSVKNGVRFIEFTSLAKLIPLVILVLAGAGFISTQNLRWGTIPAIGNIGAASLLLFFAFLGLEGPLSNGGEIKNPRRTVPLGVFWGIAGVLVLYISIQLVTQGVLGNNIVAHKDAPLAAVAGITFGKWGPAIIIAVTAIAMLGALAGDVLSIPRILFAGARDGLLPKPLAKVHAHYLTPHIAITFYAALGFLLAISGGFKQLATIASAAVLITYLGVVLASVKLQIKNTDKAANTFRMPGGFIIPVLACAGIVWLLCNLTRPELIGIAVFIAVFSIAYLTIMQLKKTA